MKLYNTLSRKKETIVADHPPQLGLYACGPTVYDYAHLGHLRKYTMDDVLIKTLRYVGFEVKFVQNITDVGHLVSDADTGQDKMEKGAKKYGSSVWDVARKFEDYFWYSMDLIGNVKPDVSCRATDHIEQQLAMVKTLEKKGFTYLIEGDGIYFDTSRLDNYGQLARLDRSQLKAGARVEPVAGKRQPTDFALWKFERPGENRAMVWPSPWHERSFPGWHIECSAMSTCYLGDQFEIHTGGIDHIPVHHTNEIAQAESATGKEPFVKYWVHHNFLQVDGQKMSKSLGNFLTIDDVIDRGYQSRALRLLFLTAHYRSEMNFTWESLAAAETSYQKLIRQVAEWQMVTGKGLATAAAEELIDRSTNQVEKNQGGDQIEDFRRRFFGALEDDLDTPRAVATLWVVTRSELPAAAKLKLLLEFDQILGLDLAAATTIATQFDHQTDTQTIALAKLPAAAQQLVAARAEARADQDWQRADQLRDQLAAQGYRVVDQPDHSQQIFLLK